MNQSATLDRYSSFAHTYQPEVADDVDDRAFRRDAGADDRRRLSTARVERPAIAPSPAKDRALAPPVTGDGLRTQARLLTGGQDLTLAAGARWLIAFTIAAGLFFGTADYLLKPVPEVQDGNPTDVVTIELTPDASTENTTPDDVPGPKVVESTAATSDQTQADDPDPPAPDSAPPTEAKRKPDTAPEATAPPSPSEAQAVLPPMEKTLADRPPDPKPIEKMPEVKEDTVERQTAPSQASTGSAALLGGGRRPSAAAQASWKGEIGTHLVHHRRYPQEARSQGWQGSAKVRVTIDENGHVVRSELVKGTGRPLLDSEALALMQRSDPFPKPPTGMGVPIVLTVPVNFSIH